MKDRQSFVAPEIEGQAPLVAVEAVEELAVAGSEEIGADGTRHVAAVGRVLDLDHLGPLVGQEHGAEGTGPVLLDGEDSYAFKRKHGWRLQEEAWMALSRASMDGSSGRVPLHQLAGDDDPLQLVGSFADRQQGRVTIVALDVEFLGIAVGAVDAASPRGCC